MLRISPDGHLWNVYTFLRGRVKALRLICPWRVRLIGIRWNRSNRERFSLAPFAVAYVWH